VEKGHGPLVLLLHGFPETWWAWRYQIDPLVRAGFRVVAPDLRGFDDSELGGKLSMDELASDVGRLPAHLGETRATLVGHDWGGGVAWHVAATTPELWERLIILNCHHAATFHRLVSSSRFLNATLFWQTFRVPLVPDLLFSPASLAHRLMRSTAIDKQRFSVEETTLEIDAMKPPGVIGSMLQY
jgi:epoxide hydrolase 4